jgi:hypothetical protein
MVAIFFGCNNSLQAGEMYRNRKPNLVLAIIECTGRQGKVPSAAMNVESGNTFAAPTSMKKG